MASDPEEEARGILEKVIDRDPHNVAALFNMGVLLADFLKRPGDAKTYFQRVLDDAPSGHPARPEAERYVSQSSSASPAPTPSPAPAPMPAKGGTP